MAEMTYARYGPIRLVVGGNTFVIETKVLISIVVVRWRKGKYENPYEQPAKF